MKSRWVFQKLNPFCVSSVIAPPKILTCPETELSVLNNGEIINLLSFCGREGFLQLGCSLHASIIKKSEFYDVSDRNVMLVWNSVLSMYAKCRNLSDATKLFDHMPMKDTVSWNSIISGFLRNGELEVSFGYFKQMYGSDIYPIDHASLTTILSACDRPNFLPINKMVHALVFINGFEKEVPVGNALTSSYLKCECFSSGRRVFDEMNARNVVTWTAVISGLAQNEFYEESLQLFVKMHSGVVEPNYLTYLSSLPACSGLQDLCIGCQIHCVVWKIGIQSDLCIESALMDMYTKCGFMQGALQIFESAAVLDEVSVTVILAGFAQNGFEDQAIQAFMKLMELGIEIDPNMVSAVFGVFGSDTSLSLGKQFHSLIIKKNFGSNPFVSNGLISMYSKCGDLDESFKVFDRMPQRNSVSWNSMISAFARHGNGFEALRLYEKMRSEGLEPTDVTFLSLLHGCSHVGLVNKGMEFLQTMHTVYGLSPRMEHYACVVDMLGRAGLLNEAKSFIEKLPVKPSVLVWQALLGACSMQGDSEMGKYAADQLFLVAPDSPAPYVLMANIYSSKGRWKERAKTIRRMKEMGVSKETGISWIEIKKKVHTFVVADQMHPQSDTVHDVLLELFRHMADEGYVPDKRFVLYYLEQDGHG